MPMPAIVSVPAAIVGMSNIPRLGNQPPDHRAGRSTWLMKFHASPTIARTMSAVITTDRVAAPRNSARIVVSRRRRPRFPRRSVTLRPRGAADEAIGLTLEVDGWNEKRGGRAGGPARPHA